MTQEQLIRPYLDMPGAINQGPHHMSELLAQVPKEKEHSFESAGEFIRRLANRVSSWRENTAENQQPVVLALLPNGATIEVHSVGEDGHSSVVIEGLLDGAHCMFISHQASFQVLCYTQEIKEEAERRTIGFHIGGEAIEA